MHRYMGRWQVLREPESARRYCGTAISLLSFCLKVVSSMDCEVPTKFTETQKAVLCDYQTYLTTNYVESDSDIERFQAALCCVLFREKEYNIDLVGRLACPIQSYIALLSLRKMGEFVKPGLVTQPIARLLYLSRMAVLRMALRDPRSERGFIK